MTHNLKPTPRKDRTMIDSTTRHALLEYIRPRFRLNWRGAHGASHWGRVETRGLALCEKTGANPRVITLFALFHDACRENEYADPLHGTRGARLAERLHGKLFTATDAEMILLIDACTRHSDGHLEADITVQTCWDADRLDLPRVGIEPLPEFLCTDAARATIGSRSVRRSARLHNRVITRAVQAVFP